MTLGLADYFDRNATALSQALNLPNSEHLQELLRDVVVGVAFGDDVAEQPQGRYLAEFLVRILARLYPGLTFRHSRGSGVLAADLQRLAVEVNPRIEIGTTPTAAVVLGKGYSRWRQLPGIRVFAGCDAWDAKISEAFPQPIGVEQNPFGAAAAACLATNMLFQKLFMNGSHASQDTWVLSTLEGTSCPTPDPPPLTSLTLKGRTALIGVGAIGTATAWVLRHAPLEGSLHLVDSDRVELSNLQRYVLFDRTTVGRLKVDLGAEYLQSPHLDVTPVDADWGTAVERLGYEWDRVLVAVDSARVRREVQASLPRWIANAWTQPGDLGTSLHPHFAVSGACLNCLYLPGSIQENEDQIVAAAVGLADEPQSVKMQVRTLLYNGQAVPVELLALIAERLHASPEAVMAFSGQPLRTLYSKGVCGGAILSAGKVGALQQDTYVPMAHQSALAGVLLAAKLAADLMGRASSRSEVTRLNLVGAPDRPVTMPILPGADSACVCNDPDYQRAYDRKYVGAKAG